MVLGVEINGFVVVMTSFAKDGDGGYGGWLVWVEGDGYGW